MPQHIAQNNPGLKKSPMSNNELNKSVSDVEVPNQTFSIVMPVLKKQQFPLPKYDRGEKQIPFQPAPSLNQTNFNNKLPPLSHYS